MLPLPIPSLFYPKAGNTEGNLQKLTIGILISVPCTSLSQVKILTIHFSRDDKSSAGNFIAVVPKLLIRMHKIIKLKLEKASIILKEDCLILSSKSNLT